MLRLNLSTRPFYNERGVLVGIGVVVLLTAALSMFNVAQIMSLNNRNRELVARVEAADAKAADFRAQAQAIRQAMNRDEVTEVQADARAANQLIERRVFSWTDLFNRFEETVPPDVRVIAVTPQIDSEGRMLVAITVISRRHEERDRFIERLEDTGAFRGVLSRNDDALNDGTLRSVLQGYYVQTERQPEAIPTPAASDSSEASGNMSSRNTTPTAPEGPR